MNNGKMKKFFLYGFTLVELMVVCGIIAASAGIGITQYNAFSHKRRLTQAAGELAGAITVASSKATAGDSGTACANFQGYRIDLVTSGSYSLKKCCEGACSSAQSTTTATYTLPAGITFSAPAANTTYLFNKLVQTVTVTPQANTTITLRNTATSKCVSLTVSVSGIVDQGSEVNC